VNYTLANGTSFIRYQHGAVNVEAMLAWLDTQTALAITDPEEVRGRHVCRRVFWGVWAFWGVWVINRGYLGIEQTLLFLSCKWVLVVGARLQSRQP
jgi:hypothetical protein